MFALCQSTTTQCSVEAHFVKKKKKNSAYKHLARE